MKKQLICIMAAAVFASASPAVLAEGVTYNSNTNSVTSTDQAGKQMVLITDEKDNIAYVNETDTGETFDAAKSFLLKNNPEEGLYTIKLGADGTTATTRTFYIGMNEGAGDIKMTKRILPEDNDGFVRYACMISGTKEINTVIVKINGEYFGFALTTPWSVNSAASIIFGVQIEGDEIGNITDVWLSERKLDTANNSLTKGDSGQ